MTRPAPQTNPLGVAVTVGATIALAAGILLYNHPELILWLVAIWTACGLLIGAVFVAEGWLELRREVERLEYEADALHQENCQLHDELGEARLWAGDGPRLRVVRDDTPPVASDDDWFARLYDERGNVR